MKNVTYTPEELDFFGLSPKDNLADYDPLEYIAVVNGSLAAGKLDDYTLAEIQGVEKQLKQVYSLLSAEQIYKYFGNTHETLINLTGLRQNKELEQENQIKNTLAFLNEVVDEYNADAPENFARKYIADVSNAIAAGKLDGYDLTELQEIENKLKEAYLQLPGEEEDFYLDICVQTIGNLTDLQNKNVEVIVPNLIEDYFADSKKNPQSWEGFNPGMYKLSSKQSGAVKPISEQLKDTVEYGLADLIAVADQEKRKTPAQKFSLKDNSVFEEEYSLGALLGKVMVSPTACTNFKAHCVVQPKQTHKKVSAESAKSGKSANLFSPGDFYWDAFSSDNSRGLVEIYDLFARLEELSKLSVSPSPAAVNTPVAIPVTIQPSKLKSKSKPKSANTIANTLAKAAIVAAAGIASLIGYNSLSNFVNATDDHQLDYYHGSPSVEVVAPVIKVKTTDKIPELKVVKTVNTSVEQPAAASQAAPKAPHKTVVKELSQLSHPFDIYDSNIHSIQKGDTFVGLWKDYHARGGTLDFKDYLKSIKGANTHIENLNKIFPGQEVELPSY